METQKIFENLIKIEPKVMSIESLFNNDDRLKKTDYKPPYQRNYVWDDEKATYFIESILLGTEIPPLVYFRNSDRIEIIDGRQRYQTILRFIRSELKLKANGLQKLAEIGIANKTFKNIDDKLVEVFWETKLRIIEFSFHSKELATDEIEETVKKEIFKRYNSGITPLKPTEIDKAAYYEDDLNSYIKRQLNQDQIIYKEISDLFHFEKTNIEIILKKVRQLLVLHNIPIKYYSIRKDTIIAKYYEFLFSNIEATETQEIYNSLIKKINLLKRIKVKLKQKNIDYNRLISECLFWGFSILEQENINLASISEATIEDLARYIELNIKDFSMIRSSFSKELYTRYTTTSKFLSEKFDIKFENYLNTSSEFKKQTKDISPSSKERISFDELRINKPEPSSITIDDISRLMQRHKFLIRPPYQRNEVINKKKSSSIIESILLGIKLPPIFVFKRTDGISEILDGQQRLLSILGFMEKPYLDENNNNAESTKNGYSLSLKHDILSKLDGKKFLQLDLDQQEKIKNFDLWFIEINQKYNTNFEPIDLFIRLNNKPYPIKEDTFEMWNSYISKEIINSIKSIHNKNKDWFYFRKNNSRMEDENIYTSLIYLQYTLKTKGFEDTYISKDLDVYKIANKVIFRLKSKNEITRVLEEYHNNEHLVDAINEFEYIFLNNLKELLIDSHDDSTLSINKNLDLIFGIENGRRTQQGFYALWSFLYGIPIKNIKEQKLEIRASLKDLIDELSTVENKLHFDSKVIEFKERYGFKSLKDNKRPLSNYPNDYQFIDLEEIVNIYNSLSHTSLNNQSSMGLTPTLSLQLKIENFKAEIYQETPVRVDNKNYIVVNECRSKVFIKKNIDKPNHLTVAHVTAIGIPTSDYFCLTLSKRSFLPNYILSILGSKYIFHYIHKDENLNLSISVLKTIRIPLVEQKIQKIFDRTIKIIQVIEPHTAELLFFERLLDCMVYELYFQDYVSNEECELIYHLIQNPHFNNDTLIEKTLAIEIYKELINVKSPISLSLLKFNILNTIKDFENVKL